MRFRVIVNFDPLETSVSAKDEAEAKRKVREGLKSGKLKPNYRKVRGSGFYTGIEVYEE